MKFHRTLSIQNIPKKEESWSSHTTDFKTYYNVQNSKQCDINYLCWYKDGDIGQWKRRESPKLNFHIYDQMKVPNH